MSWLFSRALVEEYSVGSCSDGEPSVPSSGSHTPQAYLSPDRMTAFSRLSRFGMTFKPLTEILGAELLTWFLADSRARTSAFPEKAQESMAPGLECGHTWRELWAKYDQDSYSWKTLQPSLLGDSDELSPTWPRSGMTAAGQCWALPMSVRRTSGTGFGSSQQTWPTPRACGAMAANITPEAIAKAADRFPNLETVVALRMWPTPNASDNRPRATQASTERRMAIGKQISLEAAVKYQTPVSRMHKDNGANPSELERNSPTLAMQVGGSLNPTWVEWLMGWPPGWTDLKPLVTVKSRYVRLQPGECFQESVEV